MFSRNRPVNPKRKRTLMFAAIGLLAALMLTNFLAPRSVPSVDPSISIGCLQPEETSTARTAGSAARLPDDGEVYRTADRLREASALALAATLYAATQEAERRSAGNVDSIIGALRSLELLPPGITPGAARMLLSDLSTIQVRFRPQPLAIEVLSFPRAASDGPALLVRLPGSGKDGDRDSIFFAERLGEVSPPAPFASTLECMRAGWIDQPIHQADTPEGQQQELRRWLTSRLSR